MKSFALKVQRFLASEDGPTAVEYAVMLALIIIVCLTAISSIGTNANQTFSDVADQLGAGGTLVRLTLSQFDVAEQTPVGACRKRRWGLFRIPAERVFEKAIGGGRGLPISA